MGDSLKSWVKNRLHDVLGMSDGAVAEYLIKLTQKNSSQDQVISELRKDNLASNDMLEFINELWEKSKGSSSGSSSSGSSSKSLKRPAAADKDSDSDSDSEGEGPQLLKKSAKTDVDDGLTAEERERLKDLKERDEFALRLQQKDEDKTRHIAG
ncbi:unnamed protein product, partial [Meganyctiphanes norvegica]